MTTEHTKTEIRTSRADLADIEIATAELPDLADGEILFAVQRFGFSANNITYATLGEDMGYWRFFPTEKGWGITPVWGHATVVESRSPEVEVGNRYFGYFPLATHLVARPVKASQTGFMDGAPHRLELPAVYQRYTRVAGADDADQNAEDQDALWRPLFVTSYGAADFLQDAEFFGAASVVLTSASSKTAMGIAFCLKHLDAGIETVGLTSPGNLEFTEGLGYYDRVLTYDSLSDVGNGPIVVVDLAGDEAFLSRLAEHAGDNLVKTVILGATHWQARERNLAAPREGSELFFLPSWIVKRADDWGQALFFEKSAAAWSEFAPTTDAWMTIDERVGADAIAEVYRSVLAGDSPPDRGYALTFN